MFMFTYEKMLKLRDGIIAKTQDSNFQSKLIGLMMDKYRHIWKFGEKVAGELDLSFDRSERKWVATHKDNALKAFKFAKKPSKTELVMQTIWAISLEVSKGNKRFLLTA